MMPLTISTPAYVASLDVYSASLLLVDAFNHTSSKIPDASIPTAYLNSYVLIPADTATRCYAHGCPSIKGIYSTTTNGNMSLFSIVNVTNSIQFWCDGNPRLRTLNLSGSIATDSVDAHDCSLISIDLRGVPVKSLMVYNNNLTSIDLSQIASDWTEISVRDNVLQAFNVTASSIGSSLVCYNNQLTSLNITYSGAGPYGPLYMSCYGNSLSTLNLSTSSKLETLLCNDNLLTSLNIKNTNLSSLDCSNNQLNESQIDDIFLRLSESVNVGVAYMSGSNNAKPSVVGIALRNYLTASGWVITDSSGYYVAP